MIRTALYKSTCKSIVLAGLLGAPLLAAPLPAAAFISVGISVGFAPPPLPVYAQPYAPGPGYIWTPGYWAWDGYGYYWVPGTWILPPQIGLLWTPGWWGWDTGYYRWHAGYWGPSVGFYGGINYGFGYFGVGYVGGRWHGNDFYYNRAVSNVNVTNIRNVYVDKTVINNYNGVAPATRVSYNGGRGGLTARPTQAQLAATQERRFDPTAAQVHQRDLAKNDPAQQFKANHGRPSVTATSRPGNFKPAQTIPNGAAAAAPQSPGKTPRTEAATSRSDGFVHAPRATQSRTTTAASPSAMKAPSRSETTTSRSDGFVHAPRATQSRTTTAASPSAMKAPPRSETATSRNDGFVHAPHAARNPTTTASRSPTRT
ncbi:MAG: YXWGXW repeat-containing protein [Proteobacteria bacterium]|nr:YXWGXW repeat-containing protein [Pseudomonadota bacterium]